jgi:hypothetical protein
MVTVIDMVMVMVMEKAMASQNKIIC